MNWFKISDLWNLGWLWSLLFLLFGVGALNAGCSQEKDGTWRADAQFLADAGFEGDLTIIYGSGHVAGQSFNFSGSNGVLHAKLNPKLAPSSQPASP